MTGTGETYRDETDDSPLLASLPNIAETFNQLASWSRNKESEVHKIQGSLPVVIVDTHGHAQLDRERNKTYDLQVSMKHNNIDNEEKKHELRTGIHEANNIDNEEKKHELRSWNQNFHVKSLACSVEPADFNDTLKYAATSDSILPALGVHPWYIENLPNFSSMISTNGKDNHGDEPNNIDNFEAVDSEWLLPMEKLLLEHPKCLVGEIGLCKIAKWVRTYPDGKTRAMDIQKRIFKKQMILAAKLRRPVSVHCVNSHGIFVAAIKELVEKKEEERDKIRVTPNENSICSGSRRFLLPPAIAMHSFTGTAHHVKELLDLEHQIDFPNSRSRNMRKKKKTPKNSKEEEENNAKVPSTPPSPLFYFGYSHTVNYAMCTSEKSLKKGKEAVQSVPLIRLLVESDVHSDADVAGGTIGAISYVSWARDMHPREIASTTAKNGSTFLGSIGS
eukprot:CAMPEP_0168312450 /NCGR_PEP_ID=MMETSP0142_2-20121227/67906_1 /TAXON_ID=44445 /ORGANISM="Pseudo-nitzschia australis, Strain 10249 10 AB" /LENGTH=446 /DNA_ID=CAMNT_0008265421 /DNA_START=339 /DNA_END=1680 /DNA_ORIENTATION=+